MREPRGNTRAMKSAAALQHNSDNSNNFQDSAQNSISDNPSNLRSSKDDKWNSSNKKHDNSSFYLEKEIFSSAKRGIEDESPGSNWRNLLTPNKKSFFENHRIENSDVKDNFRNPHSGNKDSFG